MVALMVFAVMLGAIPLAYAIIVKPMLEAGSNAQKTIQNYPAPKPKIFGYDDVAHLFNLSLGQGETAITVVEENENLAKKVCQGGDRYKNCKIATQILFINE